MPLHISREGLKMFNLSEKDYIDWCNMKNKKRITLQNMKMLIEKEMIPEDFEKEIKIFNFNKYLKKNKDGKLIEEK